MELFGMRRMIGVIGLCVASGMAGIDTARAEGAGAGRHHGHGLPAAYTEMIEQSLENKTGLTFFLNGQALPAVVTKIIDERTIEGRSQQYDRIVIRLSRVNAIARQ